MVRYELGFEQVYLKIPKYRIQVFSILKEKTGVIMLQYYSTHLLQYIIKNGCDFIIYVYCNQKLFDMTLIKLYYNLNCINSRYSVRELMMANGLL